MLDGLYELQRAMGSNVPLTPTMRFVTRSTSTRRKRKRVGVYTVSGLPASITHITPGFAPCDVVLAICLMYILLLDQCYALLPVKSHRASHAGQMINLKRHIANPTSGIWLRSTRNDNLDIDGRTQPPQPPDVAGGNLSGDYTVLGTSTNDSSPYADFPQQTRNRLADRIRQLHQQPQSIDDATTTTSTSDINFGNATPFNGNDNANDASELYLQVKQGLVQIKSKEQHSYVFVNERVCDPSTFTYF